jgi:hypothetical protein
MARKNFCFTKIFYSKSAPSDFVAAYTASAAKAAVAGC